MKWNLFFFFFFSSLLFFLLFLPLFFLFFFFSPKSSSNGVGEAAKQTELVLCVGDVRDRGTAKPDQSREQGQSYLPCGCAQARACHGGER